MNNIICYSIITHKRKNQGGDFMCTILEKIRDMSASDLLKKFNIIPNPTVDVRKLLNNIGISALSLDFTDIEKRLNKPYGSILGAAISKGDNLAIFYRENDTFHRQKFTIAHELAHCCLHCPTNESSHIEYRIEPYQIYNNTEIDLKKENEANIFAGQLLIPKDILIEMYDKMIMPSLSVLSEIFDVSATVMAARLDYLKLGYYKDVQTLIHE